MRMACILAIVVAGTTLTRAQDPAQVQTGTALQTARQALLEMFTSKTPGAFERHLPEAARHALLKATGAPSSTVLGEFAAFRAQIAVAGEQLQTYDSGPVLLSVDEKPQQQKFEVQVDRDDLYGDEDEIELSFHAYQGGQPQSLPVRPRMIISMKQEKEVWTLHEVTVAFHVPLADPTYLQDLQQMQNQALQSSALAGVMTLITAETSYIGAYPGRGFTCKLSELGGTEGKATQEHALLIDSALASGKKDGYVFSITGCDASPSSKFQLTATPAEAESGMRTYCSNESGVIRYVVDGNADKCLSDGVPLQENTSTIQLSR